MVTHVLLPYYKLQLMHHPCKQTDIRTQVLVAHLLNFGHSIGETTEQFAFIFFSADIVLLATPVIYWDYDNVKCGDIYWHFLSRLTD